MSEDFKQNIHNKIIHLKSRPTRKTLSEIYIEIKKNGYNINKLSYENYDYENIIKYCEYIENVLKDNTNINTTEKYKKKNNYINVIFKEHEHLPKNIYVNECDNYEDKDYHFLNDKDSVVSSSDDNSEKQNDENENEDDLYYDSGNDEFSE